MNQLNQYRGTFLRTLTILSFGLLLTACNEPEIVHVGPNWAELHELEPGGKTFVVEADVGGKAFKIGEELKFNVTSPKSGRLWIVQVDPNDEVSLLFPNQRGQDNGIQADERLTLPRAQDDWLIEAAEPKGKSVVAFIVTTGEHDLHDVLGTSSADTMDKALRLIRDEPAWAIAKRYIDID